MRRFMPLLALACVAVPFAALPPLGATAPQYDVVIRGGTIYDGTGGVPYQGDVAVKGDRIVAIAAHIDGHGQTEIDARGKAVSPGFINMLAHPEESLIADGRGLSDLQQGVTLEVMGEDSMGPLTPEMKKLGEQRQGDIKYPDHLDDARRLSRHAARRKASRPTSPRSSARAPCAPICWAKRMCSRRRSSSRQCKGSSSRRWRKGRWA